MLSDLVFGSAIMCMLAAIVGLIGFQPAGRVTWLSGMPMHRFARFLSLVILLGTGSITRAQQPAWSYPELTTRRKSRHYHKRHPASMFRFIRVRYQPAFRSG